MAGLTELAELLVAGASEMDQRCAHLRLICSVHYSPVGKSLDVQLDTGDNVNHEWIKGEGADIGLMRSRESKRLAGAYLPCYAKTLMVSGNFPTITIDLATGKVEIASE